MAQPSRQRMAAGNWKMNTDYNEGRDLILKIIESLQPTEIQVVLAPPFIQLKNADNLTRGISNLHVAAQNCHQEPQGAFTGEVSAAMVRSTGATYVILGHSERREYFGEDDALLSRKVQAALKHQLRPIFCCGEKLEQREAKKHEETVKAQLEKGLFEAVDPGQWDQVVIAYEPVWAIGTGKTAKPKQAQDMHAFIRSLIEEAYGAERAEKTTILYGGSVKPANAAELFEQPDVDGGLVGGASLKADDFIDIVKALEASLPDDF